MNNYKVKWSNFHITVNFNTRAPGIVGRIRNAVERMVDRDLVWTWLKQYKGGGQRDFEGAERMLVERVRIRAAIEGGGQQNNGIHAHIVVEVAHRTMVQVNKDGVCNLMRDLVGSNPNVHCRFIKGDGEDKDFILRYLMKEVPAYRPKDQFNQRLWYAFGRGTEITQIDRAV
jgi:hypothetical protein